MLPIDRTAKSTLDNNLINGITSDAPAVKNSNDVVYNTIDELYNFTNGLIAGGVLQPYPAFLSRQALINGNFDIWQRGLSWINPTTYTADRWRSSLSADGGTLPSIGHNRLVLAAGEVPQSPFAYWINPNGAGTSLGINSYALLEQYIENGVRLLCGAGKKLTVSFWARSDIANKRIGIYSAQTYGTGGTPSAGELISGTNFTLTSTWTKYAYTFTTNTLSGKTLGTDNNDTLNLTFTYMWGSNRLTQVGAATAETFGGNGNIYIAQVQINAGDRALPFQPRSVGEELQLCRRYFQQRSTNTVSQYDLSPTMRVNPSIVGSISPYNYDAEF